MSDLQRSGCPINLTLEVVGDKWSLLIIRDMMFGNRRHYRELLGGSLPAQYKDTAWCRELAADTRPWHDKPADPIPEGPDAA